MKFQCSIREIRIYLVFLLFTAFTVTASYGQSKPVKIGWIREGMPGKEAVAVDSFLSGQKSISFIPISLNELTDSFLKKNGLNELWWIKDSEDITAAEKNAGMVINRFVSGGGHLLLSMEAVRFLNIWGIEKNPLEVREDTVIDEGFGRPRGFHSYHSHPIFQGLHGGAFTWKGKTDHVARAIGFFGQHLPDTTIAKVIGIGWSYITFHEDQKLVLEYKMGKGSIIAVGAYSYFSKPNFNTAQLYRFYTNMFNYWAHRIKGVVAQYWSFKKPAVIQADFHLPVMPLAAAGNWNLPELTLSLKRSKATKNFVDVSGRRMLLMGKEQAGIDEIWTHPFMAFRDIQAGIRLKGQDTVTWLQKLVPEITVSPEMLIRKYTIGADTLSEVITVDFDQPAGVLHFQWSGDHFSRLYIRYTSNLREMWPYSDSAAPVIQYQWSPRMNASVVRNGHEGVLSIFGFSDRPANYLEGPYNGFKMNGTFFEGIPTTLRQVNGIYDFEADKLKGKLNVYLLAGEGMDKTLQLYEKEIPLLNKLYKASSAYYKKLLKNQLMITTPDKEFNQGYRWAMVRSDQFLQTTPGVGTSMMAGFSTTATGWNGRQKVSGRPGYAWYFGRDGEWSGMALDAMGGFDKVKKVLAMFVKYQALDGKIFHELTSSGSVHYDAADATPLFILLAGHYLHYSGDISFIRSIWPSIEKAISYCYSTDTDHDGLIENTNVGHGWIEGGPLFGSHTEFYLAGCWAAALDAADFMAGHLQMPVLQKKYRKDSRKVKEIIDRDFWSSGQKSFYNGKMSDGTYMKDETVLTAVPILLNTVTDFKKASKTTESFAASNFSTDWGMRIIPEDNPKYNPYAYHAGMVWPLFTGYASLSEYKTDHYTNGFTHLMSNLLQYSKWSLGSIAETMSGSICKPAGVCSQQGWSETMVIQPAIEGMLGFLPDATQQQLSLTPCFPWNWKWVKVSHMRVGNTALDMNFHKDAHSFVYDFTAKGGVVSLEFNPVFAPGTVITNIRVNGRPIHYTTEMEDEGVKVIMQKLPIQNGMKIIIEYSGGTGVLPLINGLHPGASNAGAKIIQQHWQKDKGLVKLEGICGKRYQFKIFSTVPPKLITNGTSSKTGENTYLISTQIPDGKATYGSVEVALEF